jgi:asparagine N-glycosylation enzyme membrane subunit Stt3
MRQSRDNSAGRRGNIGGWVVSNWRSLTVLSAIVLIAFMLRMFFAYGTSAGSGFALSGGADAVYHLHVIEQILNGGFVIKDTSINYPFGGTNYNPPLFDISVAILAYPLKLFGFSTAKAASIALVYSTAIVGALTCIPVYKLGKEMFSRKAGYIAAAFFALSSVAIVKTVFSNGTESAFFVFFFVLMTLFLLRAVKAFKPSEDGTLIGKISAPFGNKTVFRNMIFAALSLTALMLSWIGFPAVVMVLLFIMLVQAVFDRLRGVSATAFVSLYGSVILFALLISALYYAVLAGMTMFILGPLCLALLMIVISFVISHHRVWVITIPVSIAVAVAVFLITSFFMPALYAAMTSLAFPYAEGKFGALLGSYTSVALSSQAIYAGVVTMWFSFIVATYMLLKLRKKADSPSHIFITMWFLAMIYMSWKNMDLALLAAPMYAIGTGVVIIWLLRRTDIKGYAESFKGTSVKTFWRKMIKPIPFLTVLGIVFILIMPNVLYAVDASIPSNKKADYDANMHDALGGIGSGSSTASVNYLGATNYYIKDNDWSLTTAWDHFGKSSYSDKPALVTWLDYGAEAAAKGNFNVVADHFGNGVSVASNVLTGTSSDAIAAMAVRLLTSDRSALNDIDIPQAARTELENIVFNGKVTVAPDKTASNIDYVRSNPQIFGPTDFNISAENAMYLVALDYIKKTFTDGEIADMYNKVIGHTEHEIGYIGVTGSMLPIYYGDNNLFSTIAYLNDHYLDRNAAPTKYYTAGVPWTGYYFTYKDAMYETMIWKALIGMSLNEYRAMTNDPGLSQNTLINGLMLSDGTYKAYPGYGLTNFSVDPKEWWVMYTASTEAPYENWKLMNAFEAQELQDTEGGTINYLGGMAFLRYDGSGNVIKDTVVTPPAGSSDSKGVGGLTVALFGDEDGERVLIGKTMTNKNGEFSFMVTPSPTHEIVLYSGTVGTMEVEYVHSGGKMEIKMSDLTGTISDMLQTDIIDDIVIELIGKFSGEEYYFNPDKVDPGLPELPYGEFSKTVVPDTYAVKMTLNNADIYTGTFTLHSGAMDVGVISVKEVAVEVTVKDKYGALINGAEVDVISTVADESGEFQIVSTTTNEKGVAKISVAPGTYTVQLKDHEYETKTWMLVSSSSTTTTTAFTARLNSVSRVSVIMVEAAEVFVNGVTEGDEITIMNGAYTPRGTYSAYVVAESSSTTIFVPVGDYLNASSYTVSVKNSDGIRYFPVSEINTVNVNTAQIMHEVKITMTYKDKDGKVSDKAGVISFVDPDNKVFTVPIAVPEDGEEFKVWLPKENYTVYAYTYLPDKTAYIGLIGEEESTLDIKLVDAILLTGDVRYSAYTTTRLANVPVIVKTDIKVGNAPAKTHTIVTSTDALGSYQVLVPKGNAYDANTKRDFGYFARVAADVRIAETTQTTDKTSGNNLTVNVMNVHIEKDDINVADATASFTVSGTVRDAENAGLRNAVIEYTLDDGSDTYKRQVTSSGTAGTFSIPRVSAGTSLEITKVTLEGYETIGALPEFKVTGTTSGIEIVMDKEDSDSMFVSGVLRDINNTLRTNIGIKYTVNGGAEKTVTTINTYGTFRIPDVETGDVIVFTGVSDSRYRPYGTWTSVTVGTDPVTDVVLMVEGVPTASQIPLYGRIVDDGSPATGIIGARIDYKVNGTQQNTAATSGADGIYRLLVASGATIDITGVTLVITDGTAYTLDSTLPTNIPAGSTPIPDIKMKRVDASMVKIIPISDDKDVDITVGKSTTANGKVTLTLNVRNNTASAVMIVLSSDTVSFRANNAASTVPYVKEYSFNISATTTSTTTVSATYDVGDTPKVKVEIMSSMMPVKLVIDDHAFATIAADHDIVVKQGSTVKKPTAYPNVYELIPQQYDIKITPKDANAGDTGYYYSGKTILYAGMDTLTVKDLIPVTVVTFEADKDDKITLTSKGAVAAEKAKDDPEELKKYYVPTADLSECTITIQNKDKIAYIDLSGLVLTSPIDVEAYTGDKISVSGYVGRVADGEMVITMTAGALTGTCTVPISKGEFKADLPKDMNGAGIVYSFEATVRDIVNGTGSEFVVSRSPVTSLEDKDIVNMEVKEHVPVPSVTNVPGSITVTGNIKDDDLKNVQGVKVAYETSGGVKDSVTTDAFGNYTITVTKAAGSVEITGVTKAGYKVNETLPVSTSADAVENFTVSYDVTVDQMPAIFTEGKLVKAVITMDVTNNHGSTVVLSAGKGWLTPSFGTTSYVVVDDGAVKTVTLTAYYDPEKEGAGSDNLSVIVKDLMGTVLQTKTLDTKAVTKKGDLSDLDADDGIETGGNRVSKDEYGFAITFKNETDKWIDLTILPDAGDYATLTAAGWYVSLVDSNNVKLDSGGSAVDITVNGNSSVTYYVRLISIDDPKDMVRPGEIKLMVTDASSSKTIILDPSTTDLSVDDITVSGNNIFSSLNNMPNIVWVMFALAALLGMLVIWLGIRRGVFVRKR